MEQAAEPRPFGLIVLHILAYGAIWILLQPDGMAGLIFSAVFAVFLIWLSVVDFRSFILPDRAQLGLFLTALIWLGFADIALIPERILAGVVWAAVVWVVGLGYRIVRGDDGLGFGDVKLMGTIGVLLGYQGAAQVLLLSAVAGLIAILVFWRLRGREPGLGRARIAFGAPLCLSAWIVWLFTL